MSRIFTDGGSMSLASIAGLGKILDGGVGTWAGWAWRTAAPAAERGLVGMGDFTTDVGWWVNLTAAGLLNAMMPFATANRVRTSVTALALNAWTHFVVRSNSKATASTEFTFVMNGIPEAGTSTANGAGAGPIAGSFAVKIGPGPGTATVNGTTAPPLHLGPIAYWNRILSDAEAAALAGGYHPARFPESLVDWWEMENSSWEEGGLLRIPLIQGATNPAVGFVRPPIEPAPSSRTSLRSKNRYLAIAAAAGITTRRTLHPFGNHAGGRQMRIGGL
jgi:hypothetical protein